MNSDSTRPDAQNALLHADFGLTGKGDSQQSTLSVTIGQVEYDEEVDVSGKTIGSSRGIVNGDEPFDVKYSSPIRNTAAGEGGPALKNEDGTPRAGSFVLQNIDLEVSTVGTERPFVGQSGVQVGQRSALSLQGWAAGLAEFQSDDGGIGVTQIDTGDDTPENDTPENFTIETDPETNRVEAKIKFLDHEGMQLGGLSGNATKGASAFVDDNRFAARTVEGGTAEVAMITSDVVKPDPDGPQQDILREVKDGPPEPIRDYKHLKWGYFFGDTLTKSEQLQHVHLGSWVAGKVPKPGDLPSTGTATYTGHAIGNVFNGGSRYTAVGSVENTWNFGTRRGTMEMQFDGATLNGSTKLRNNSVTFDGTLDATNRVGSVRGNFVQGVNDPAAGVIGRFSIQETPIKETPDPSTYRASGTFAAEKN